jgi:methylamine dehydrogenase heavy chain
MRLPALRATATATLLCLQSTWAAIPQPLPAEQLTVERLGHRNPHWTYVLDTAFHNENDSRVHVLDGDSYRNLGQVGAGFYPSMNLSPDHRTLAVLTTYFSRGWHGDRADVVEFTDLSTLTTATEIVLPPKHGMSIPTYFNVGYSEDGKFIYVSYLTPAASIGVLDPVHRSVLGEIDTAGCVLAIASGPNRVSSICDSGRLLTVTLDDQGHEASRATSGVFFDVGSDPIFVQGVRTREGFAFLSFLGDVHEVDFRGGQPLIRPAWSLVSPAERGIWRPGGSQVAAIHLKLGKLFVPVHRGGEGTHKDGGTEIWVFDVGSHRRVGRWLLDSQKVGAVTAVQVSQDDAPILFAATTRSRVAILNALTGQVRHPGVAAGQTPSFMLNP